MKHKINCGIITFHEAINYGAVLQTFALKKVLSRYCNTFIVRHHNQAIAQRHSIVPKIPINGNDIKSFIIKTLTYLPNSKKHKRFLKFREKYLYDTDEDKNADFYITGSDQVWNYACTDFDRAYFLDKVDGAKKNSYSASFGFDKIPEKYVDRYRELLKDFNKISVREFTARGIIKDLLDRDVDVTLDPTLLITKEEWGDFFKCSDVNKPYLLVYAFAITPDMATFINKISAQKKLQVIVLAPEKSLWRRSLLKKAKYITHISPEDWIRYFYNASFIVTNSFHGTVFSINFNKQFAVELLPPPAKVNSRLTDILKLLNLESRYISNPHILDPINYKQVNEILDSERTKSLNYISGIVSDY